MLKTRTSIGFEDLIEILHEGEATDDIGSNIIETSEMNEQYHEYFNKYIDPIYKERGHDVGMEADVGLAGLTMEYERRGFEMGFKTAMALITGNGVSA